MSANEGQVCNKDPQFPLRLIGSLLIIMTVSGCGPSAPGTTPQGSTSGSGSTQAATGQTSPQTTTTPSTGPSTPATTPQSTGTTTTPAKLAFEKLDQLSSYRMILTAEALAGPAKGTIERFEAEHIPPDSALHSKLTSSKSDYAVVEECIVIGSSKWVKPFGKTWEIGDSLADNHVTFLSGVYLALQRAKIEPIDTSTVAGLPVDYYRYTFETKSTRMTGEVWIANKPDLEPVPLKGFQEQMALENGSAVDDYRHVRIEFELLEVNPPLSIKPPV